MIGCPAELVLRKSYQTSTEQEWKANGHLVRCQGKRYNLLLESASESCEVSS